MRQRDLVTPGLAPLPAVLFQQVSGGGERVGSGVLDIAQAFFVGVNGMGLVAGRDELGMAYRAGPRADQMAFIDIARLQDLERSD